MSFWDIAFEPKPVQQPHLPIWIGGDADAALKPAAKFASGPEGHRARRDPHACPGRSAQEIVDCLSWAAGQGVASSAVPVSAVLGIDEYLDYTQWVVDEINLKVG